MEWNGMESQQHVVNEIATEKHREFILRHLPT
jgi:hypothetical protein